MKLPNITEDEIIAFVDGSYNSKKQIYGYGVVMIDHYGKEVEFYNKELGIKYANMRNVAGEIHGALAAVKYAIVHGKEKMYLHYDYKGIEQWAIGKWKTNTPGTKEYVKIMTRYKEFIDIEFIKVAAHSGIHYNDRADELAKKGARVIE